MLEIYEKLLLRLQSSARAFDGYGNGSKPNGNRANGGHNAVILEFRLYLNREGSLVGWSKPLCVPLEPKPFDLTVFELIPIESGWNGVFLDLVRKSREGCNPVALTLVVRENGEPAGWFADRVKVL